MTNEAEERARKWRIEACRKMNLQGRFLLVAQVDSLLAEYELAARAASPVSAPVFGVCEYSAIHAETPHHFEDQACVKWVPLGVAPVSAEQPTKIASGRESAESELNQAGAASNQATEHKTAESRNGREANNTPETRGAVITTPSLRNEPLAAPSVASEDSATQPMLTVLDHKYVSEVCHEKGCQYLVLAQPGSEDWMRKAAMEVWLMRKRDLTLKKISAIIAKHYAASQLSTEKK